MAVKLSFFAVILTLCVCLVLTIPVAQVLQESKTMTDMVKNGYYNDVFLPRFKKAAIVVSSCPKGMEFYNNRCLTPKEYKRQQDEDYGDEVSTVGTTDYTTTDELTEKDLPHSVTVASDFTTYTEATVNVKNWSNNETKYNNNTGRHTTEFSSEEKDKSKVTANHSSSTDKTYNNTTEADATETNADHADKNPLRREEFNELETTVFVVCCCFGLLIWLPWFLCQRYLRRNDLERSNSLLPSSSEVICDASSLEPILTMLSCQEY